MTSPTRALALSITLACLAPASAVRAQAQAVDAATETVPEPPASAELIDVEGFLRGEGRGVTAEEAARAAVRTAPSIDATRAQLAQAEAGASRAMLAFFPRLELQGRYTRLSPISQPNLFGGGGITPEQEEAARALISSVTDPAAQTLFFANLEAQLAQSRQFSSFSFPVILDNFALGASLTIPVTDLFLQVWPSYEAAQGAARAQQHQVRARSAEVAQQAREAFYQYARARGALAVAQAAVSAAELQAELIDAMVRAGTTAQVDAIRVQAQVAAARVAAIRAEAGVRIAEMAVRTIMHLEPDAQVAIAEDLLEPLPAITGDREGLITSALDRRAEMLAIRQAIYARGRQIDAAEGSRWPHLIVAGNFTYANPNQRVFPQTQEFRDTWDLSVLLTWSPNDFFTGEIQASEARSMRAQAESDLRTLEDGIRMQVTQAYENLRAAQAAIEAARTGVEAADETLRVRHEQYRAGATVVTELVLAVNERARAQLDLIGAALDARIAHTQLQRAIGSDPAYEQDAGRAE